MCVADPEQGGGCDVMNLAEELKIYLPGLWTSLHPHRQHGLNDIELSEVS